MKLTIECEPKEFTCFVAEFQKMLTGKKINAQGITANVMKFFNDIFDYSGTADNETGKNADNAVEEQNRQEIINKQIELLIEASKHVQWDKLPSVSLALDTLLQNQRVVE